MHVPTLFINDDAAVDAADGNAAHGYASNQITTNLL
jgi:hypothetical protein